MDGTVEADSYLPPCREANLMIAPCPTCGRQLRMKTLLCSHVRGRSFDAAQRAREQQLVAEHKILLRNQALERREERVVEHRTEVKQPLVQQLERVAEKKKDYSNFSFN